MNDLEIGTGRIIAIAHRVKALMKDGKHNAAQPTKVLIIQNGESKTLSLATEADELEFVCGKYVTKWGKNEVTGDPVIASYTNDGLQSGDTVLMSLGGSGDPLAYAISRKGEDAQFMLYRTAPWRIASQRGEKPSKQSDRDESELDALVEIWSQNPEYFSRCDEADRIRMNISFAYRAFKDNQKARMAHEARMRQSMIGRIFMSPDGLYPEGLIGRLLNNFVITVKKVYAKGSRQVKVLESLTTAESSANLELEKAVIGSRVWQIFEPIRGIGPSVAGGIISSISDIRRFKTEAKLWSYCGLHALRPDFGKFQKGDTPIGGIMARRRGGVGQISNWNPTIRQALWLFGEQLNRQAKMNTYWGNKLLENKAKYREKYPNIIENVNGKLRYNPAHIHRLAVWKTLRQFTRWLHREWTRLENDPNYIVKHPKSDAEQVSVYNENTERLAA